MSWSVIAEAEVLQEFNSKENAAINNIQGATDNLAPILQRIVNMARGYIVAGGSQVDQAGTIPDQLRPDVIAIARWKWLVALPKVSDSLQTKERKDAHDEGVKRLDDVSNGKIKIELPAVPVVQNAPVNAVATPRPGRPVHPHSIGKMSTT